MKTYILHRVGLFSLFKFGFIAGLLWSLIPNMILAWLAVGVAGGIANWLLGLTLSLLPGMQLSLVELFGLQGLQSALLLLANLGWFQAALIVIGLSLFDGLIVGLAAVIGGAVLNLLSLISGGLELTMSEGLVQPASGGGQAAGAGLQSSAAAQIAAGPWLEITEPVQRKVVLGASVAVIGSDATSQVQLEGLQPQHAQISFEGGRYILRDLSAGQSWIQGHPVQGVHMLKEGFVLRFDKYTMVFHQG